MSLTCVKITEEAYLTCLTHALSTETEEIMGLLFGEIEYVNNTVTALVWGVAPQTRSDRRKDRVETNPEQLAAATCQAERMSVETGRSTRVIGWYHSHPHITVMPSHVDVRTQRMYQMLDSGFVGLIFSCFNEDGVKGGRIQVIAFQSLDGRSVREASWRATSSQQSLGVPSTAVGIPVSKPMGSVAAGESSSSDMQVMDHGEEADLKGGGKQSHTLALQQLFTLSDNEAGASSSKSKGVSLNDDSMDLSGGLEEAMLRSNYEYSGADYIRKEIPLQVVPGYRLVQSAPAQNPLVELQRILFTEEQDAYHQALVSCTRQGRMHPLAMMHHSAMYQASLAKLIEYCLSSVLSSLMDKNHENKVRLTMLQEETDMFLQMSPQSPASPRYPPSPSRGILPVSRGTELSSPSRITRHNFNAVHAALQERQERRASVAEIDLIKL